MDREEFKKHAVVLSKYISIMDRELCQIPSLCKGLTDHDRTRIGFVLGVMKEKDLSTYSDEAEDIMLRIDPNLGPSEDVAELLQRWRRGPSRRQSGSPQGNEEVSRFLDQLSTSAVPNNTAMIGDRKEVSPEDEGLMKRGQQLQGPLGVPHKRQRTDKASPPNYKPSLKELNSAPSGELNMTALLLL
jgi:hypothetical protein